MQYMLCTGWNWNISRTAVCCAASVVDRPCGIGGIEGKKMLRRIFNRMDSEYSPVALDGVSLSFKEIIDLRIPLKADKILNR